ncbi:hypothetical protein OB13_08075 [Pontibacter sp. HJ8]
MRIFHNKYCAIHYYTDQSLLLLEWLSQPDIKSLLSVYNKGIDFAIQCRAENWIADNHRGINLDVSMQRALAELSADRLQHSSIRRFARVVPLDIFQEMVSHQLVRMFNQHATNRIRFELFSNAEDARYWVQQEDAIPAYA